VATPYDELDGDEGNQRHQNCGQREQQPPGEAPFEDWHVQIRSSGRRDLPLSEWRKHGSEHHTARRQRSGTRQAYGKPNFTQVKGKLAPLGEADVTAVAAAAPEYSEEIVRDGPRRPPRGRPHIRGQPVAASEPGPEYVHFPKHHTPL
jgi:hypothetical protein